MTQITRPKSSEIPTLSPRHVACSKAPRASLPCPAEPPAGQATPYLHISGDTECTPEGALGHRRGVRGHEPPRRDAPSEAATCVNAFRPKVVYPYHYRGSDPRELARAVTGSDVEARIRDWYAP